MLKWNRITKHLSILIIIRIIKIIATIEPIKQINMITINKAIQYRRIIMGMVMLIGIWDINIMVINSNLINNNNTILILISKCIIRFVRIINLGVIISILNTRLKPIKLMPQQIIIDKIIGNQSIKQIIEKLKWHHQTHEKNNIIRCNQTHINIIKKITMEYQN